MFTTVCLNAQNYLISFTGSGASITIDSIQIENLFQGTTKTLGSNDELNLLGVLGIESQLNCIEHFQIYPNPMCESTKLEFYNPNSNNVNIEIFDINGKRIVNYCRNIKRGNNCFEISGLSSGVYYVNVGASEWQYSTSLISVSEKSCNPTINFKSENSMELNLKKYSKSNKNVVPMQYNNGDRLLFRGFSGNNTRILTLAASQSQTVNFEFVNCADADGNNYAVVTINTQTWIAENLKTTKYNDNTTIPLITDNIQWAGLTSPGYCWYENDSAIYGNAYGALYNWFAVDTLSNGNKNICPIGWHVASNVEWDNLVYYVGSPLSAGGYLKETDTLHWYSPNTDATNFYGFTALPAGYRSNGNGGFGDVRYNGTWWTTTELAEIPAYHRAISWISAEVSSGAVYKEIGKSVRCVKD